MPKVLFLNWSCLWSHIGDTNIWNIMHLFPNYCRKCILFRSAKAQNQKKLLSCPGALYTSIVASRNRRLHTVPKITQWRSFFAIRDRHQAMSFATFCSTSGRAFPQRLFFKSCQIFDYKNEVARCFVQAAISRWPKLHCASWQQRRT